MAPRDIELQDMPFAEPEKPVKKRWNFRTRHYVLAALGAFVLLVAALFASSSTVRDKVGDAITNGPFHGTKIDDAPEGYSDISWWFQNDLEGFPLPEFKDIEKLRDYPPHNFHGTGDEKAFATFFATHNGSTKDPYFIAAQEFVYRLLWDPEKKSKQHPVIVFVPNFISLEQRQYFAAAGAIVRELNLREYTPEVGGEPARLQDMFTKLEMWRQTDFDRIMYIDSDAIPYVNIDSIFDFPEQQCVTDRLSPEDLSRAASICDYVFAAWPETVGGQLNAGVMLLKPNRAMYRRLVRESQHRDNRWQEDALEQAFLDYAFRDESPFPARRLPQEWNGAVHMRTNDSLNFKILHTKVWSLTYGEFAWASGEFNQTWDNLKKWYESPEFLKEREKDREIALADAVKLPQGSPTEPEEAAQDEQKEEAHDEEKEEPASTATSTATS